MQFHFLAGFYDSKNARNLIRIALKWHFLPKIYKNCPAAGNFAPRSPPVTCLSCNKLLSTLLNSNIFKTKKIKLWIQTPFFLCQNPGFAPDQNSLIIKANDCAFRQNLSLSLTTFKADSFHEISFYFLTSVTAPKMVETNLNRLRNVKSRNWEYSTMLTTVRLVCYYNHYRKVFNQAN